VLISVAIASLLARLSFLGLLVSEHPRASPNDIQVIPAGAKTPATVVAMKYLEPGIGEVKADYHATFDGHKFMDWFEQEALPALGDTPSLIILDNAPYHLAMSPSLRASRSLKKGELFSFLHGKGRAVTKSMLKPDLIKEFDLWVEESDIRHEIKTIAAKGKHAVLFTPPYMSILQPIERLWALVKGRVARSYFKGRKFSEVRAQTKDEFKKVASEGELLQKIIEHSMTTELPRALAIAKNKVGPAAPAAQAAAASSSSSSSSASAAPFAAAAPFRARRRYPLPQSEVEAAAEEEEIKAPIDVLPEQIPMIKDEANAFDIFEFT